MAVVRGVCGVVALAVLVALPAGPPRAVPVVAVSQGPGGGSDGGGGTDGGSSGDVIPNPRPNDDSDSGGGAGSIPEPRRPEPAKSTDGGQPAPPKLSEPPRPPDQPLPPDNPRPPSRPDVPAVAGSARIATGGSDEKPAASSGSLALEMDPETADALRDYLRGRRPEDRRRLDFSTTRVTTEEWTALVTAERGDPAVFGAAVTGLGGPEPFVTQTPLLLRDEQGRFGTATLFRVALSDGGTRTLDAGAAGFDDLDDFLEHNRLPATWTMVYPAGIRPDGDPSRLLTIPAHTVTPGERVLAWGDRWVGPAAVGGWGLLRAASGAPPVIGRYQPGRDIGAR